MIERRYRILHTYALVVYTHTHTHTDTDTHTHTHTEQFPVSTCKPNDSGAI